MSASLAFASTESSSLSSTFEPAPKSNLHIKEAFGADYTAFGLIELILSKRTAFQFVQMVNTVSYGLALYLDGAIQSAEFDEYIYHEALVHPVLANLENPKRVLILGGGEGASAREVLRYDSVEAVDMVDIDGELVELCKTHLPTWSEGAFNDPRLIVHIEDALLFVKNTTSQYDLIILDLIDEFSSNEKNDLVDKLYSEPFFTDIKKCLTRSGAMVIQASEFNQGEFESFAHIYRVVEPLFPVVEAYSTFVPSFTSSWGFIVCNSVQSFGQLDVATVDANIQAKLLLVNDDQVNEAPEALEFYDGLTHQHLFALPKDLRTLMANQFVETN